MTKGSTHEVTGLLQAWAQGDEQALQKLIPLVHRELRQAARHYMAGKTPVIFFRQRRSFTKPVYGWSVCRN